MACSYRTLTVAVQAAIIGTLTPAAGLGAQERPAPIPSFDELIQAGMRDDRVPGLAVAVVDSGRITWVWGYGVADVATGREVDPEATLFRLGSVTKALTALGVLRLVDRGAFTRSTSVGDVTPLASLTAHPDAPVRIGHLLTHTGGFDQTGLGRHAESAMVRPTLRAFLETELVPIRPPGSVATYDTYGMSLAGHVLEVAGGADYAEFMRREVFQPVGMQRTFIEAPPDMRQDLAVGYGLRDGELIPQPYEWYTTRPASSADGTVSDLARLLVALLGDGSNGHGRLLLPETAAELRDGAFRGLRTPFWDGWWAGRFRGRPVLYHGGVMRGYSSQIVLVPERRAGLVVLYNRDPETGPPPRLRDRLTLAFLQHMLVDATERPAEEPVAIPTEPFAGWWIGTTGCFSCRAGEGWEARPEQLTAQGPGVIQFLGTRWVAVDSLTFRREGSDGRLWFARDREGRIRYANAGHDGFERLDSALVARVAAWAGPGRSAAALRARLTAVEAVANRARAMAALARRPPTVDPAGTFLVRPAGRDTGDPMRLELRRAAAGWEGWAQGGPDRPRRPVRQVAVGGNEVWVVVEVPGGELELRLTLDGERVTGLLREGLEEVPVTGRHLRSDPSP